MTLSSSESSVMTGLAFSFAFAYIVCAGGSKSDNRTSEVIRTNIILLSFRVVNPPVFF